MYISKITSKLTFLLFYTLLFFILGSKFLLTTIRRSGSSINCTTTGRIVNSVRWFRDGIEISRNNMTYSFKEFLSNPFLVMYTHILSSLNTDDMLTGTFACEVSDKHGNAVYGNLTMKGSI